MVSRRGFIAGALSLAALGKTGTALAQMGGPGMGSQYVPPLPPTQYRPFPDGAALWRDTLASTSNEPVGVALQIVIDASGSMNDEEYRIQNTAHAAAFMPKLGTDPVSGRELNGLVESAIRFKGGNKSIAVCVVEFSSYTQVRIPWVDFRADDPLLERKLALFAARIGAMRRAQSGSTDTIRMLDFSHATLRNCPWQVTEKKIIDVCSDGRADGSNMNLERARNLHAVNGVTINALAIVNEVPDLDRYYQQYMVTQASMQGPDGIWSEPGYTWTIARNMRYSGNSSQVFADLSKEVEYALKMKISTEVAGYETVRGLLERDDLREDVNVLRLLEPGRTVYTEGDKYVQFTRAPFDAAPAPRP